MAWREPAWGCAASRLSAGAGRDDGVDHACLPEPRRRELPRVWRDRYVRRRWTLWLARGFEGAGECVAPARDEAGAGHGSESRWACACVGGRLAGAGLVPRDEGATSRGTGGLQAADGSACLVGETTRCDGGVVFEYPASS